MVKVKYLPEFGTPSTTENLGIKFDANEPTEVADKSILKVLRGNPFFEVLDKDVPAKEPAKTASAPATPPAPVQQATEQKLEAVVQADGSYAILQAGAAINHAALSKEEADAFNQLSDEDKAEYVK